MKEYKEFLNINQRTAIVNANHKKGNICFADCLKAILRLDDGYSFEQIAKINYKTR